jgi:hypothetical protein
VTVSTTARRLHEGYQRAVGPREDGLPRTRVLLAFPAVLLAALVVLVALALNGTSSGILRPALESGPDPQLVSGEPQPIRSDEYIVHTVWLLSQVEQGFPVVNEVFPGGMNATVQNELPAADWSAAFRPHLLAFFFLPADQAVAARWWIPGFALMAAAYLLAVTVMPRRPVTAAALSVAFFYSPFFQWWFLPITFWPVAWALTTITAIVWAFRSRGRTSRILLAALAGYLTVTTVLTVYVPFIIPCAWVVIAVAVGFLIWGRGEGEKTTAIQNLRRFLPLLVAAAGAVVVVVLWVLTRLDAITGLLGTVYPGLRSQRSGELDFDRVLRMFAAPFTQALEQNQTVGLGPNSSEASTFFLTGLFLVPAIIWLMSRQFRASRSVDPLSFGIVAALAVFSAFAFLPGWDPVARVMLLDRVFVDRMLIGFGLLSFLAPLALVALSDRRGKRLPAWMPVITGLLALSATAVVYASLRGDAAATLGAATDWKILALGLVGTVVLLTRPLPLAGAMVALLIAVPTGSAVNPVYRGVFKLNDTAVGRTIERIDPGDSRTWMAIGSRTATSLLVEAGAHSYSGVQTAPSEEMWEEIDPDGSDEQKWNRLADVSWTPGTGEPVVTNPAPDSIRVTFDSCSRFAAKHIDFVLADVPLEQDCARQVVSVSTPSGPFTVYEVVPRSAGAR